MELLHNCFALRFYYSYKICRKREFWRKLERVMNKNLFVQRALDNIFENKQQNEAKLERNTKIGYMDLPTF